LNHPLLKGGSIKAVCNIMTNTSITDPLDRLVAVNNYQLASYQASCLDISYTSLIDYFKETSWYSDAASGEKEKYYIKDHISTNQSIFNNFFKKYCE
jgi:hypothetical protein